MKYNIVEEYITSFPQEIMVKLESLRTLIKKICPDAIESMSYGMPAYKYQKKPLIYFAGYEYHIGIYATPSANIAFAKELSWYKQGKWSIQFPLDQSLPLDLIEKIIIFKMNEINKKSFLYSNKSHMEKYSHGSFTVTGIVMHIPSHREVMPTITKAWKQWFDKKIWDTIIGQAHPSMHAVYYNYDENRDSFDMLIGVMTQAEAIQKNSDLNTITIPAQHYQYVSVSWGFPDSIWKNWYQINQMTADELPRTYGYDLEMYNEAGDKCTIAVSVQE